MQTKAEIGQCQIFIYIYMENEKNDPQWDRETKRNMDMRHDNILGSIR